MSARSYLSIGDVLTLLRQEFPDVTISKIRFLESQGLVNPERTPSGYRKFYEHDVERLRWVLRQQREHFLPLKVIKDRLDDDPSESTAAAAPATAVEDEVRASGHQRRTKEPVLVGHRVSTEHAADRAASGSGGDLPSTVVGDGSTLPGIESTAGASAGAGGPTGVAAVAGADPARRSASAAPPTAGPASAAPSTAAAATTAPSSGNRARGAEHTGDRTAGFGVIDDATASDPATSKSEPAGPTATASTGSGSGSRRSRATPTGPAGPTPKTGAKKAQTPTTAESEPDEQGAPSATNGAKDVPDSPPKPPSNSEIDLSGASLSVDELSAACGLDVDLLRELQAYGLLVPDTVAGVECFGEEALAVANLAAQFARFGIEPRHLRLYKNAAEREAGFVEQIVLPLVRQRNPEARARARETADELTRLGQQLRGSLLRSALGNLLNG